MEGGILEAFGRSGPHGLPDFVYVFFVVIDLYQDHYY